MNQPTLLDIMNQIEDATKTMRRLPGFGKSSLTYWPDFIRKFEEAYGYDDTRYRITPSAKDITRLEEVIDWLVRLNNISPTDKVPQILWARGEGYSWRKIAAMVTEVSKPKSHETCRSIHRMSLAIIMLDFIPKKYSLTNLTLSGTMNDKISDSFVSSQL